jgi:hypothetical protein
MEKNNRGGRSERGREGGREKDGREKENMNELPSLITNLFCSNPL